MDIGGIYKTFPKNKISISIRYIFMGCYIHTHRIIKYRQHLPKIIPKPYKNILQERKCSPQKSTPSLFYVFNMQTGHSR